MGVPTLSSTDAVVAPLAGAWIEIANDTDATQNEKVAPLAGAWIEMI